MPTAVRFDAYDPAFVRDPYPTYRRLLAETPVFHDDTWGLTFFARHSDVTSILRDRRFGRDIRHVVPVDEIDPRTYPRHLPNWYRMVRGSFIDLEPPEHTRIRSHVSRSFTKRRVEEMRADVEAAVTRAFDALADGEEVDLVADLATPVPITVIAEMMGVPASDHQMLLDWSHAIVRVFDLNVTPDEEAAAEQATIEFSDHLRGLVAQRRADPGDDLISHLVHEDDPLDEDDLVATCILVLNAGHEATVHAIGNGMLALARNPGALDALRADPEIAETAVEELLRYDPPLHMFERWVLEDLEWDGVQLKTGDKLGLLFGAANHDPEVFDEPDTLDLTRDPNPHIAFGMGIHLCVGAPLARLELEAVFATLARRYRSIDLVGDEPPRTPSLVFRGPDSLPARLVPAGPAPTS
ncbi:MAG: cytochrome P450 [Acidimicrobiia bacterium]|nr:cytochrome P450 [Acidimicrobiia bacterium]